MKNLFRIKDKELKNYAKKLLNNGFRVFVYYKPKEKSNWIIIEKNNNIGYVQFDSFRGFSFSTKHKPNFRTGTGYQVEEGIHKPNLEHAKMTFLFCALWENSHENLKSIIKYKNIDEYLKQEQVLNYVEVK